MGQLQTSVQAVCEKGLQAFAAAIEDAAEAICADPNIGEAKVGDLIGMRVYKFRFNRQEYLIAYRPPVKAQQGYDETVEFPVIDFYLIGSHENFYDTLKRYLKEE